MTHLRQLARNLGFIDDPIPSARRFSRRECKRPGSSSPTSQLGHWRFLGATNTAEVVGKSVFDFFPTEIAAGFHAEDLRVLRLGEPVVQSVDETVDSAGNKVWMSVTKISLRDEKGELIGLVSTTCDITARKNAEEQLAKYAEFGKYSSRCPS